METTKLKRFAAEARTNLMDGVRRKLQLLGFDKDGNVVAEPQLLQGGSLWNGEEYPEAFYRQWTTLRDRIHDRGVREVVEEASYIWFNRMMAIRILTMNGLCEPVLRYDEAIGLPLLLSDARMGRVPEMSAQERARFNKLMDDDNRTYDQFALLLTAWCHANPVIHACFGSINDYVELLLPDNILRPEGFIAKLNETQFISDEDYKSAELIGWLYQFYISDRKDEVFAKKGKVEADEIPAATQIFTPNWIVKYMVQNTILSQVDADEEIIESAKYLVKTENKTDRKIELEDLKVADFACGSGHILNECFDLLFDLYRSEAYSRREAIECIFTKNLTGIDIDLRAKQLATFALLLKACQKDASFADAHSLPHVISIPEIDKELIDLDDTQSIAGYLRHFFLGAETKECSEQMTKAIALLKDADSLGSIIKFDLSPSTRRQLVEAVEHWKRQEELPAAIKAGLPMMDFILTLTDSYDGIVMNPPYMPTSKVEGLKEYAAKNYPDSKTDLFSVFMDVCIDRLKDGGKYGMINMQSWMFLSSFEALRKKVIDNQHIDSLLHLGPRTFDELSGEVVQNAAFVITKEKPQSEGIYYRLIDGNNCSTKRDMLLEGKNRYVVTEQKLFEKIPGVPIAYWVSENTLNVFNIRKLKEIGSSSKGIITGNNDLFIHYWHEVNNDDINFEAVSNEDTSDSKWYPLKKGGSFRRWYGNLEHVIEWQNKGYHILRLADSENRNKQDYADKFKFQPSISWSGICSGKISFRFSSHDLCESGGMTYFPDNKTDIPAIIGFLNSKIAGYIKDIINPTLNCTAGNIESLPFFLSDYRGIEGLVNENISICKQDWDAHETSWDFEKSPLLEIQQQRRGLIVDVCNPKTGGYTFIPGVHGIFDHTSIEHCINAYKAYWEGQFMQLHANEEELNHQFIEIYGLQDELTPEVPYDEVTILQQGEISINNDPDVKSYPEGDKEITYKESPITFNLDVIIKQLISYIVGVWMGRYRLDRPGVHIAHPNPSEEELAEYTFNLSGSTETLRIDDDAIIPVLPQDAPFFDNLYNYLVEFVRKVWGEEHLAENINFIEKCLGKNLNDYLMKDFWKDHKKMYQNRPIYWEFASKKGAFRALVYAHRMDRYTVEVLRSKYLLPYRTFIERKIAALDARSNDLSTKERKELDNLRNKILPELSEYAERVEVIAQQSAMRDPVFDLDDGIIKNHALFGDIVTKLK